MRIGASLKIATMLLFTLPAVASEWSEPGEVLRRREGAVVSYRAKIDGDLLVIEVSHKPEWHTYTMDNIARAKIKSGENKPETELPTRIEIAGGLEIAGIWHQSEPKELSEEDIKWYTWGFEGKALFAVRVQRVEGGAAQITINGQACNASSCSMVDDVQVTLSLSPAAQAVESPPMPEGMVSLIADPEIAQP